MGGEAEATGQIKRLMAPSLRIAEQASQCDCERSAWISLTKTDVPGCSLSTSPDWTIKFEKNLFYTLKLQEEWSYYFVVLSYILWISLC